MSEQCHSDECSSIEVSRLEQEVQVGVETVTTTTTTTVTDSPRSQFCTTCRTLSLRVRGMTSTAKYE